MRSHQYKWVNGLCSHFLFKRICIFLKYLFFPQNIFQCVWEFQKKNDELHSIPTYMKEIRRNFSFSLSCSFIIKTYALCWLGICTHFLWSWTGKIVIVIYVYVLRRDISLRFTWLLFFNLHQPFWMYKFLVCLVFSNQFEQQQNISFQELSFRNLFKI
jgi:hypothetical protein